MRGRWGLALFLALCLTLSLERKASGYLIDEAGIINHFTMRQGEILAELTEPSWEGPAGNLAPGDEVAKDPLVTNTSTMEVSELVAVRLVFTWADGTALSMEEMESLAAMLSIDYQADGPSPLWHRYEGEDDSFPVQHFYYERALARNLSSTPEAGENTIPLFTHVGILPEVGNEDYALIQEKGGFTLVLSACAISFEGGSSLDQAASAAGRGDFIFP